MSENSKQTYAELMAQLNVLQLQMLELEQKKLSVRIQRTLIGLSKTKDKSRYVRELESQLAKELATHHRSTKLDIILEMIERVDDVAKHIVW